MRIIEIQVLKDKLSEYVNLAAGGETVLVTDRDVVIAELGPPHPDHIRTPTNGAIGDLVRRGLAMPARNPRGMIPPSKPALPIDKILRDLREDRDSR